MPSFRLLPLCCVRPPSASSLLLALRSICFSRSVSVPWTPPDKQPGEACYIPKKGKKSAGTRTGPIWDVTRISYIGDGCSTLSWLAAFAAIEWKLWRYMSRSLPASGPCQAATATRYRASPCAWPQPPAGRAPQVETVCLDPLLSRVAISS